jgi:hypothetical protein
MINDVMIPHDMEIVSGDMDFYDCTAIPANLADHWLEDGYKDKNSATKVENKERMNQSQKMITRTCTKIRTRTRMRIITIINPMTRS